mmetsp:Transcript_15038/g.36829  ORF Transcript_15038/g.36829 Transcript_15038/m.36829 type:complete len:937 (-) Transcript_15038:116-2926(-)
MNDGLWGCKTCTLANSADARRCAACNQPRARTRAKYIPEPSVSLIEDRAFSVTEQLVVEFVNPHQDSFDVVSVVCEELATENGNHWPIPGVTAKHWKYVGAKKRKKYGCLDKEPIFGSVRFDANVFEPGSYQIQLRYYLNGSWSNIQARGRLDIAATPEGAQLLPPPSLHPVALSNSKNFPAKLKHRALVGLQNIGNTCYMNAAVQCLATLTPMMDAFLSRNPGPEPPDTGRKFFSLDSKSPGYLAPLESPKFRTGRKSKKSPKVELTEGEWQCTACTLTNPSGAIRCQICGKLAGREIREQIRKQDGTEPQASVQTGDKNFRQTDEIRVEFLDPTCRAYTVVSIIPKTVPNFGDGIWPVSGWSIGNWLYTDGTGDSGIVGSPEGTLTFPAERLGGGEFQVQLRYYQDGSWNKVAASTSIIIEGSPLKSRRKRSQHVNEAMEGAATSEKSQATITVMKQEAETSKVHSQQVPSTPEHLKTSIAGSNAPPDLKIKLEPVAPPMLHSPSRSPSRKSLKPGALCDEFTRLVHILNDFKIDGKYVCPEYLKFLFEYARPEFKGNRQHDCQEFTQALLDELNRDLRRVDKQPKIRRKRRSSVVVRKNRKRKIFLGGDSSPPTRAYNMLQKLQRPNGSLISEMFFGMLENRIECQTCFNQSTVYSTFSTVSLDIPSSNGSVPSSSTTCQANLLAGRVRGVAGGRGRRRSRRKRKESGSFDEDDNDRETKSLHECFEAFTKEERLCGSNAYFCSKCNKRGDATKRMMFYHLPQVLIIHLKRFSSDESGGNEPQIQFPNELDLSSYCLRSRANYSKMASRPGAQASNAKEKPKPPPLSVQACSYRLVGVVNYQQNEGYKHYTALTLAKFKGNSATANPTSGKRSKEKCQSQPFFGHAYENDNAGWVEFDDEKAWTLSNNEARSERARRRTQREAYLLFYEAAER